MRIQTLMTLLLLTTSTATALPIDNSWIQDHFDVGISMLMGGSLASQIPAAWKRFDTFVRANHDLVTYGLSQHQRDVISCAQRAIDNEDFLAGRSAKERGEVAWKNCEDNPQWDPAVEMCVQRAVENESFMPGRISDQRREAARKICQENPNWNLNVDMKGPYQGISERWKQRQQQKGELDLMYENPSQFSKDSKGSIFPGLRFTPPVIPKETWGRIGAAIGRARPPLRMMPGPRLVP